jgi:hypothetical protein
LRDIAEEFKQGLLNLLFLAVEGFDKAKQLLVVVAVAHDELDYELEILQMQINDVDFRKRLFAGLS